MTATAFRELTPSQTFGGSLELRKIFDEVIAFIPVGSHSSATQSSTGSTYRGRLSETSANPPCTIPAPSLKMGRAIHEVRRLTGLTWDEIADLFQVTRRSAHYWANGGALSTEHALQLAAVQKIIKRVRPRPSKELRLVLLARTASGERLLELLRSGNEEPIVRAIDAAPRMSAPEAPHPDTAMPRPWQLMGTSADRPALSPEPLVRSRRLTKRQP